MQAEHKGASLNRLNTVRGDLDGTIRMVEDDTCCVDTMKQFSALQASIERANRLLLKNHLEMCVASAVAHGDGQAAVAELVDALKFSPALTAADFAAGPAEASRAPGAPSSDQRTQETLR